MKVYQFYLHKKTIRHVKYPAISEDNIFETKSGKYACLYGYTDSKLIRDEFIEYRNMNIFKLKEVNMSKEEYEIFEQVHPNELIEYNSFGTMMVESGITKVKPVQLVVTNKEASMVFLDHDLIAEGSINDIFTFISSFRDPLEFCDGIVNFSNIFKHDIRNALEYLEFTNIMLDYFSPDNIEMPFRTFSEDKLMVYIKLFGNTYKNEVL